MTRCDVIRRRILEDWECLMAPDSPMDSPMITSSALNRSRDTADSDTEPLKANSSPILYAGRSRDSLEALATMAAIICIIYVNWRLKCKPRHNGQRICELDVSF